MTRSKIGLIIAASLIVIVGPIAYVILFGFQTMMSVEARYIAHKSRDAWQTPVPLPDTSVSSTAHKQVSYFGYELELPWDDVDPNRVKAFGTVHVTYFLSGNVFWFSTFGPKNFINEVMKTDKMDADTFRGTYGNSTQSDYDFYRTMLEVTPDSIGPLMSQQDDSRNSALLVLKAIAMPNSESGIFDIRSGDLRGFQFNGARGKRTLIVDDLYGDDGGVEIWFGQEPKKSAPAITQPEINRVLKSIHKISAPPPTSDPKPRP